MKLKKLSDRIWYYPYEEVRDRPNLGYIKGDSFSVAVDAGHSASHTEEFYRALVEDGLPLPTLTIITHWHWDHTFGMHSVNGLCIANSKTKQHLSEIRDKLRDLCEELVGTISSIGAEICLEGHWTPDTPDGIIKDIMNFE